MGGVADELAKLAVLAKEGVLTSQEFERAKDAYLGQPPDKRSETLDLLRQLHSLVKSKVLTEGEFNIKKWDILSRHTTV